MAYQPKSYRKFLAGTVTTALVASAVAPVAGAETPQAQDAPSFTDVNPSDVHAPNIQKAVELGLVNGYGDEFRPYNNVTRGQVALILSRWIAAEGTTVDTSETEEFADVPSSYYDEELYEASLVLRELGIFTGTQENNFNPNAPISRQAMAKVLVEAFGLEDLEDVDATVSDIEDAQEWAQEYINILVENGVTVVDEYKPLEFVTRAQFSTFAIRSLTVYEESLLPAVTSVDFNEEGNMFTVEFDEEIPEDVTVQWVLDNYDVEINGMPVSEIPAEVLEALALEVSEVDGMMVTFSHTDLDDLAAELEGDEVTLSVDGVEGVYVFDVETSVTEVRAINPTTLLLTGTSLGELDAADISIDGFTVESFTATEDGNGATVRLGGPLTSGETYTVSVAVGEETLDFDVDFVYEISSIALNEKTYDDDTSNQLLTFNINGQNVVTDYNDLLQQGYDVEFAAVDEDGNAASIFATNTNNSTTGLLAPQVAVGDYEVEVIVTLDNEFVVSDSGSIEVRDLEGLATSVESATFTNFGADDTLGTADDFTHRSTTLIEGESASVSRVVGDFSGKDSVSIPLDEVTVSSSNPAVVSVSGTTLTANAPGTATITIQSGTVSREFTFTVQDDTPGNLRVLDSVSLQSNSVKLLNGSDRDYALSGVDQYGDSIEITDTTPGASELTYDIPVNAAGNDLVTITEDSDAGTGEVTEINVQADNVGKGTVIVRNSNGTEVGRFAIDVTGTESTPYQYDLWFTADSESKDYNLANDLSFDNEFTLNLVQLTSTGYYVGNEDLVNTDNDANYYITIADTSVVTSDAPAAAGTTDVTFTSQGEGSTEVIIRNAADQVVKRFNVTVTDSAVFATEVDWEAPSTVTAAGENIDISDVLDVRAQSTGDSIVYGIEHNAATGAKVRVNDVAGTDTVAPDADAPVLYIDLDDNGQLDATDETLGTLTATPLSGFTGTNFTAGLPFDVLGGTSTSNGDEGTILFKIEDGTTTVSSTTITVDVE
ncbi:S-layer homology domain-containing protein [Jeotgalibacillus terrae]|uniref:S-layer homology domain-containing protein n=1 Tax=Jeotgalibacillus terrae TaxID=587735 RepID=A0ABW5ZEE1_9BACL|nr:S-layer homology domain-containing protein [Jeotgalibacillus terrae]MBM7577880.1 hypothetical protein [Jeotgalibacillus terrae]